jgi:hypothetical protein
MPKTSKANPQDLAQQLVSDYIDAVLDFDEILEQNSGAFENLVKSINPQAAQRASEAYRELQSIIPKAKWAKFLAYEDTVTGEAWAREKAAFRLGVAMGVRLSGGAR